MYYLPQQGSIKLSRNSLKFLVFLFEKINSLVFMFLFAERAENIQGKKLFQ